MYASAYDHNYAGSSMLRPGLNFSLSPSLSLLAERDLAQQESKPFSTEGDSASFWKLERCDYGKTSKRRRRVRAETCSGSESNPAPRAALFICLQTFFSRSVLDVVLPWAERIL